jgi:putative transcriptional regulator
MGRGSPPERIDVKAIREQMGLSQSVFANRFGLSVYARCNWEQGKRQPDPAGKWYQSFLRSFSALPSKSRKNRFAGFAA